MLTHLKNWDKYFEKLECIIETLEPHIEKWEPYHDKLVLSTEKFLNTLSIVLITIKALIEQNVM